jgi:hypothetical protein
MTGGLPPISSSWCRAPSDSRPELFFFYLNTCGHSPYVTSSLTRRWVCRLQLLLALASAFILRSESRRTHDHILLSQIRDSSNLEPRSPYLYPPGRGWPSYIPRHWVPFPWWRYNSTMIDLGTRWRWVASFTSWPIFPRYLSDRRLGGPQIRSGRCAEEKNLVPVK